VKGKGAGESNSRWNSETLVPLSYSGVPKGLIN
jgi:hypothetical protein